MRAVVFLVFSSFGAILAASAYAADNDNNDKSAEKPAEKYAFYYSDQAPIDRFDSYQLLIFDGRHHPPLQPLMENGKMLLAYISLGDFINGSPRNGLRIKKNWDDGYIINHDQTRWQKAILEETIPAIMRDGFDGIFLDNLVLTELKQSNPAKYAEHNQSIIHLIEGIRMHYPSLKIMVNRSYEILPQIAPYINMSMGEALLGNYDFDKRLYFRIEEAIYSRNIKNLQAAKQRNPLLKIYTLDYANTKDPKSVAEIYRMQRKNGFIPYVASVGLDELAEEPGV